MERFKLSIYDTNVLKGIAILMLLCHHSLGGWHPIDDILIKGNGMVTTFAVFCRVCVAIFVFLSGYGLATIANKKGGVGNLWKFYRRRYVKLMMNYWLIWLIFVPIGVFIIGRSFQDVYGTNIVLKAILDFFGIFYLVTGNMQGYNATWWFCSCIIVLYALFPLLYKYRSYWLFIIPITIVIAFIAPRIPIIRTCGSYFLVFFCGILLTEINSPPPRLTIISPPSLNNNIQNFVHHRIYNNMYLSPFRRRCKFMGCSYSVYRCCLIQDVYVTRFCDSFI